MFRFGRRDLVVGAAVVVGIAVAALFHARSAAWPLNADAIYPLTFALDRARHGFGARWIVPPANCVFPDVLLSALGLAFGLGDYANVVFFYVCFCLALTLAATIFLWGHGVEPLRAVTAAGACVAAFVLLKTSDGLTRLYLSPAHHQAALLFVLAGCGLFAHASQRANRALIPLLTLGVASDPVLATQFTLPALIFSSITRSRWCGSLCIVVGTALGVAARPVLAQVLNVEHGTFGSNLSLEGVVRSSKLFAANFGRMLEDASSWRGWAGVVAFLILLFFVRRSQLALVGVLVTLLSVVGPVLTGIWSEPAYFRQQLPLFLIPQLTVVGIAWQSVPAVVELETRNYAWRSSWHAVVAGLVIASSIARSLASMPPRSPFLADHTALLRELEKRHVVAVAAEYWEAKPLALLSGFELPVCQVSQEIQPYAWLINRHWCDFLATSHPRDGRLAVVGERLKQDHVLKALGAPLAAEKLAGFPVWYYSEAQVAAVLRPGVRDLAQAEQ
jgi:hypothetical protein